MVTPLVNPSQRSLLVVIKQTIEQPVKADVKKGSPRPDVRDDILQDGRTPLKLTGTVREQEALRQVYTVLERPGHFAAVLLAVADENCP